MGGTVYRVANHHIVFRNKGADGSFTGTGDFSVAGGTPKVVTSTESIAIPADVASAFLQKVAAFPIKEGTYTPAITHSDDNPLLTITVDTPGEGTLTIYSQSQGDQHIPWGASIAGKDYVIDTPAPAEAIALLDPYLKREVRQQLIDESGKKVAVKLSAFVNFRLMLNLH